jgi:hypothetical protein
MLCFKFRRHDRFALRLPCGSYCVWEVGEVRTGHTLRTGAVAIDLTALLPAGYAHEAQGPAVDARLDLRPGTDAFVNGRPTGERLWALEAGDDLAFTLPGGESFSLGVVKVCCAGEVDTGGITLHARRLLSNCGGQVVIALDVLPGVDVARCRTAVEDVLAGRPSPRGNGRATG